MSGGVRDAFVHHDTPLANGITESSSQGYRYCEGCERHVSVARGFTPDTDECRVCLHSLSAGTYAKWKEKVGTLSGATLSHLAPA